MTRNEELLALRESATARGVGTMHAIFAARAVNAEIWDADGNRYIDLAAGIAVVNTGHNHPRVIAAVEEQLRLFSHTCFQVTPYEVYIRLADRLNRLAPGDTAKKTIFLTTGAEAVENAIKIARYHTGRSGVIAFSGGFHGRTLLCMGLTGKVAPYKAGFGPFPADIYHAPYPIDYHGITVDDSVAALNALFRSDIEPSRVAAIIVEPVLGEGGFYPAPGGFLPALRKICDEHGIVMVVDEIQTGFARTGRLFAVEYAGIEPDLMTVAKSLGGGLPLSGVIGKADIMDSVPAGGLGGTYGGSPLGCAAGLAVLDVIDEEKLCDRALFIGKKIQAWGDALQKTNNCIGQVRVTGAMSAIEIVKGGDAGSPDADLTKAIVAEARKNGVILLSCGVRGNVIRFLPPLTISDELLDQGLEGVAKAIGDLSEDVRKAG
jgi:4-aminobutyrate aminotransferase / (S)-3-amino-2-methylpropionate transaminase / 5-aminovalerate transaminase